MLTLAAPVLGLHLSQGDPRMLPASTQTRQMWDGLTSHFPERARWSGDIAVLADAPSDDPELARLRDRVAAVPGVTGVSVEPVGPELTVLHAVPDDPPDDPAAQDAVAAIRALPAPFEVAVAGDTAELVDYRAMLAQRLPWAFGLVALGTLLLLFAFTGSLVLPVKAVLTSLLSIGATLGVVVWVFQQGHLAGLLGAEGLGYLHLTVPVLVGAIAFGLSVDYEVFLLSPDPGAVAGRRRAAWSGRRGTGADRRDRDLRMLLVPATMTLLGRWNWWLPRRIQAAHARLARSEAAPEPAQPQPAPGTPGAGRLAVRTLPAARRFRTRVADARPPSSGAGGDRR